MGIGEGRERVAVVMALGKPWSRLPCSTRRCDQRSAQAICASLCWVCGREQLGEVEHVWLSRQTMGSHEVFHLPTRSKILPCLQPRPQPPLKNKGKRTTVWISAPVVSVRIAHNPQPQL